MHEMSIAINIVDIAVETATKNQAKKINSIVLELGKLSGVVQDTLEFCFESACKGTLAEGAKLDIISIHGEAECGQCGFKFSADQMAIKCPQCNEYVFNIQGGRELRIKTLNVD